MQCKEKHLKKKEKKQEMGSEFYTFNFSKNLHKVREAMEELVWKEGAEKVVEEF